jgi:hypothetical protein
MDLHIDLDMDLDIGPDMDLGLDMDLNLGMQMDLNMDLDMYFHRCLLLHTATYYDVLPGTTKYHEVRPGTTTHYAVLRDSGVEALLDRHNNPPKARESDPGPFRPQTKPKICGTHKPAHKDSERFLPDFGVFRRLSETFTL